jgi:hypothetical protein
MPGYSRRLRLNIGDKMRMNEYSAFSEGSRLFTEFKDLLSENYIFIQRENDSYPVET